MDVHAAPRVGQIGMHLQAGERVLTVSGRLTTPFPHVDLSTNRRAVNTIKRVEGWLMGNAHAEAIERGNRLAARMFSLTGRPSMADKCSAEDYLFDRIAADA